MFFWQDADSLGLQVWYIYLSCSSPRELMASAKLLFLIPSSGGNEMTCKIVFLKDLKKVLCGCVLFQVEKDESFELIVKSHFQRSVPAGLQWGHSDFGLVDGHE